MVLFGKYLSVLYICLFIDSLYALWGRDRYVQRVRKLGVRGRGRRGRCGSHGGFYSLVCLSVRLALEMRRGG